MKTISIKKLVANMFRNAKALWEDCISFWGDSYVHISRDGHSYIDLVSEDGFLQGNVYRLSKWTQKEIVEIISSELPKCGFETLVRYTASEKRLQGNLEVLVRYTAIETLKLIK